MFTKGVPVRERLFAHCANRFLFWCFLSLNSLISNTDISPAPAPVLPDVPSFAFDLGFGFGFGLSPLGVGGLQAFTSSFSPLGFGFGNLPSTHQCSNWYKYWTCNHTNLYVLSIIRCHSNYQTRNHTYLNAT